MGRMEFAARRRFVAAIPVTVLGSGVLAAVLVALFLSGGRANRLPGTAHAAGHHPGGPAATMPATVGAASLPATGTSTAAAFGCTLPPGVTGAGAPGGNRPFGGPVPGAVRGGPVRSAFTLDGGALTVDPPQTGDIPVLTGHDAMCVGLASMGGTSGDPVAVGYGRISVSQRLFSGPTTGSFTNRLAWLVVKPDSIATSCPAMSVPSPTTTSIPLSARWGYQIFIIDARTGHTAYVYQDAWVDRCSGGGSREAPQLDDATETVSVPWTLVSRDPDGYSATIEATVLPCDRYTQTVLAERDQPDVQVDVVRPVGATCGQPEQVTLGLHAATVTAILPATVGHDRVGLDAGGTMAPPPGSAPPTTTTPTSLPSIVTISTSDDGSTIDLTVGQVVAVYPLNGAHGPGTVTNPVESSDPAVLGPLDSTPQPLVAELRAWTPGAATLTVPQSACVSPGSSQPPCDGPFVVHVVVH
jgi:hypothetical protein